MEVEEYNYKPIPQFMGKSDWYVGIELEVEAPNSDIYRQGLELRDSAHSFYIKHDGSLHMGYELVTQPIPWEQWLKPAKKTSAIGTFLETVKDLHGLGFSSYKSGRAGMHVHISNAALGLPQYDGSGSSIPAYHDIKGNVPREFYWFRRLVHGPLFAELSQRVSWENMQNWATQIPDYYRIDHPVRLRNYNRKEAVNIHTGSTIEVRIFRGNIREEKIRKNIEAVISAVHWACEAMASKQRAAIGDREVRKRYIDYITKNATTYPNLHKFVQDKELFRHKIDEKYLTTVAVSDAYLKTMNEDFADWKRNKLQRKLQDNSQRVFLEWHSILRRERDNYTPSSSSYSQLQVLMNTVERAHAYNMSPNDDQLRPVRDTLNHVERSRARRIMEESVRQSQTSRRIMASEFTGGFTSTISSSSSPSISVTPLSSEVQQVMNRIAGTAAEDSDDEDETEILPF